MFSVPSPGSQSKSSESSLSSGVPDRILQEIKSVWTKSRYSHPKNLVINQSECYLIVISSTTTLHRCINRHGQIVIINQTTSQKISSPQVEENETEPYLVEKPYLTEIDIFAVETLFPIFDLT